MTQNYPRPFFRSKHPYNPNIIITKNYIITFLVLFNKKNTFLPKMLNPFYTYNINIESIKLGHLYLSKSELNDIVRLVAKKRHIEDYQNKSSNSLYKIFKKQSKNKERIHNIREELKNPLYNISKKESKDIKSTLYNIEKIKKISSKKKLVNI